MPTSNGRGYATIEELEAAETNGWVATAILRERAPKKFLFTATYGPYPTKADAQRAARRIRARHKREDGDHRMLSSDLVRVRVSYLWKDGAG